MIVGAGKGGTAILKILKESEVLKVQVVIDRNENAPGFILARKEGIKTGTCWKPFLNEEIDIIIDVTGDDEVFQAIRNAKNRKTVLIREVWLFSRKTHGGKGRTGDKTQE